MAKSDTVLCLDIGTDSLKAAEFSYPGTGGIVLEKFAFQEYGGDLKGDELGAALALAIQCIFAENDFKSKKVYLSISGNSAFVRFVKLPPVGKDKARIQQIVMYEARQHVPFPIDEVVWDYQFTKQVSEDSEMEVMFVVIKNDLIENITNVIERMGKETFLVEVAPISTFNVVRTVDLGTNECVIVLNIGGKSTSLIFIDNGNFFVRTIPIAGHTITQQVSKEFGIPFHDAEEMKKTHGFVALGGAYEDPNSEVAATVSKIVRNIMTRLHTDIIRSINVYRAQRDGNKPVKLFLAGGSSTLAFTQKFFEEKLRISADYLNPFKAITLADSIDRKKLSDVAHLFSEVIGLGLRYKTKCPIEVSLVPGSIKRQHEISQKTPYIYACAAILIICLGLTLWGFSRQLQYEKNLIIIADKKLNSTRALQGKMKDAKRDLEKIKVKYMNAKGVLDQRKFWIEVLNELPNILPERTWFTRIKGAEPPAKKEKEEEEITNPWDYLRRSRLNTNTKKVEPTNIEWIEIEGRSLMSGKSRKYEYLNQLRKNLGESSVFEMGPSESLWKKDKIKEKFVLEKFDPEIKDHNVSNFVVRVKLAKKLPK